MMFLKEEFKMSKQTDRDIRMVGLAIEQQLKEKNEILNVLKELYYCSSNPWTDEQAQRKLIAQVNAEEILKKYNMIK